MPVLRFVLLCFGWSWGTFAWAYVDGHFHNGVVAPDFSTFIIFALGPAIAGLVMAFADRRSEPMTTALGIRVRPNRWWLVAWSLPAVLCFGAVLATGLAGFTLHEPAVIGDAMAHSPDYLNSGRTSLPSGPLLYGILVLGALTLGAFANMFGTLSEELGWRGYLWSRLRPLGFWRANLIIGLLWGVWHAPLILVGYNYPGLGFGGVAMMIASCVLLAPIVGLMRELGRSVFAASLFHGTLNAVASISMMLLAHPRVAWSGIGGWGGFTVMLVADIVIFLAYRPGRGSLDPAQSPPHLASSKAEVA